MNRSASILIQAGFNSRLAAIKVVEDTKDIFTTGAELRAWLRSPSLKDWSNKAEWPTAETHSMWHKFSQEFEPANNQSWSQKNYLENVDWFVVPPPPSTPVCLYHWNEQTLVLAPDGHAIGKLQRPLNPKGCGLMQAKVSQNIAQLDLRYLGPDDAWTD